MGMQRSLLLPQLCSPPPRQQQSRALVSSLFVVDRLEDTGISPRLEVQLPRSCVIPWTCGLGDEAVLGGRGDQGLALGEALQGMAGNCANPPSHSLSGSSCLSLPAHVSAAWSCFPVPRSPPSQCSQSPSHPLCAQLCPADPSWQQDTAQGHLCVCRGNRAAQISPNENRGLRAFSRREKEIPNPH